MVPVNKHVYNPGQNVRFMISVRSSPPVDGLWMKSSAHRAGVLFVVETRTCPGDRPVGLDHYAQLPTVTGLRPHSPPTPEIPVITHEKPCYPQHPQGL